ncbi:MAG TPA: chemotaxis protein CheB [Kofleriaceae bacterium]|nr:chemotaxis protein CheB [Kofleriaceae bacterium]
MKQRVVVVDDSAICRALLRDWLETDGDLEVVGEAVDGDTAIEVISRLRPDVATIDLRMPGMSGLDLISYLMARAPLPILVLTGDASSHDPLVAFEAVRRGALDLMLKPSEVDDDAIRSLRARVRWLAHVPVVRHPGGHRHLEPYASYPTTVPWLPLASGDPVLVGIAASAGGPSALATVLGSLTADLPICLAIVQHLPRGFAPSFVSFLQARCSLTVCLAEHGMLPRAATVVLAPDDHHLELVDGHFALTSGPPVDGHRPSGSVLLRSLAQLGSKAIGVVLSGIGRDGADGLRTMRERQSATFAQDAESSVVYGMPRAAYEEGGAQSVLPVGQLGTAIIAAAALARRRRRL